MKNTVLSLLRHALTFGGGYLLAKGIITEATLGEVISGVLALTGALWGAYDEYKAENKKPAAE